MENELRSRRRFMRLSCTSPVNAMFVVHSLLLFVAIEHLAFVIINNS